MKRFVITAVSLLAGLSAQAWSGMDKTNGDRPIQIVEAPALAMRPENAVKVNPNDKSLATPSTPTGDAKTEKDKITDAAVLDDPDFTVSHK